MCNDVRNNKLTLAVRCQRVHSTIQYSTQTLTKEFSFFCTMNWFRIFIQVETHQYDNPIDCYSEEMLAELSEKGTWKRTIGMGLGGAAAAAASNNLEGNKNHFTNAKQILILVVLGSSSFKPQNSAVLAYIKPSSGPSSYGRWIISPKNWIWLMHYEWHDAAMYLLDTDFLKSHYINIRFCEKWKLTYVRTVYSRRTLHCTSLCPSRTTYLSFMR